jgi:TonB-dependent starch-binding outer membrane protein SusC
MSFQNLIKAAGIMLLALVAQVSLAQNKTVTGKVTDSKDGSGIGGASVSAKGSRSATQTAADGTFSLSVDNSVTILVISYVGFTAQEVSIDGKSSVEISLVNNGNTLGEVVVIGYGTARRKDLTGAITTVGTKDFVKGSLTSPEQLINGKVAGVQITAATGAPGAGGRIRVRGTSSLNASNDPLIIIDGVPVDQTGGISGSPNPLNLINPNDIETFTILKDASATAIYGNRATNGVIIITTKKGKSGKLKISFSTQNSISIAGDKVDVLSPEEFRNVVNGKGSNSQKNLLGTSNTNWQDLVYQSAFMTDNNIALTGGLKGLPYRLSLGYLNQDGILKTDNMSRFSTAINLNPRLLNNSLKIDFNLKASFTKNFFANQGAIGGAAFFDPTQAVNRNDNRFFGYWEWIDPSSNQPNVLGPKNPMGLLELREDKSSVSRYITNLQLDYTLPFFKDLRVNMNVAYDYAKGEGTVFIPDSAAMSYVRGGVNNQYEQTKKNKLFDIYLNYVKDIKSIKSRVDVMAGYGYQDFHRQSPNFPDNRANGQQFAPPAPFPADNQNTLISFYGRANFTVNNKYILTATLRRDGSSRFSPDSRWGMFPSAAFAWNIGEEDFVKNSRVFSSMKLRLGYGKTGQQETGNDYQYIPNYFLGTQTAQYQFGSTFYQVNRPQAFDEGLQWETTTTYNAGLDLGFLDGRITTSIDVYRKETEDLFARVQLPAGTNFSNELTTNIGTMENHGIEFTFNSTIVKKAKLNWDLGFNITYNKNEITKLTLIDDPNFIGFPTGGISGGVGNNIQIHSIGYQPSSFFVLQQVYDNTGKPVEGLYVDRNKDGIINNQDYYRYKSPEPTMLFGFTTAVSYERWNFSTVVRANTGNYMYNNVFSGSTFQPGSQLFLNNVHRNYLETGFANSQYFSDYYVENASFLRMDNFTASYDFGSVFNKKANLRAAFSVQNVFVISKYRGLDPEIAGGIDNNLYPRPRVYSLGLNLEL